jgi:two-component system alkaline phosphatase synthesis response regulator PhoP
MRKKILIIEDEKNLAEMYKDKLEMEGFKVSLAFNVKEGIEMAKKENPDLILLDILLEGENGVSFLKKQKKYKEIFEIPVVAFSNYDDPQTKNEAKRLGIKEYLIKTDFTPKEFVEKIKRYLTNNPSTLN